MSSSNKDQTGVIEGVWQHREIHFDINPKLLELRPGEYEIEVIESVEDTKGGSQGFLRLSNIRLIWVSYATNKNNITIGFSCITHLSTRNTQSRLRGNNQILTIHSTFNNMSYTLIFTSLLSNSSKIFNHIKQVCRIYETTRLYRELQLRGAIIRNKQLIKLPKEEIYIKHNGVWNLSSDQGNLGTMFITNIRLVWHANLAENFNVSIPYMQLHTVRVKKRSFGNALVIESSLRSGGYKLGFRVDPPEDIDTIYKAITSYYSVYSENSYFGIDYTIEGKQNVLPTPIVIEEDAEIIDDASNDTLAAFYSESIALIVIYLLMSLAQTNDIIFNSTLGLAMEKLPEEVTIESLWEVPTL